MSSGARATAAMRKSNLARAYSAVHGVLIVLQGPHKYETLSDSAGGFTVAHIASYSMQLVRLGYDRLVDSLVVSLSMLIRSAIASRADHARNDANSRRVMADGRRIPLSERIGVGSSGSGWRPLLCAKIAAEEKLGRPPHNLLTNPFSRVSGHQRLVMTRTLRWR